MSKTTFWPALLVTLFHCPSFAVVRSVSVDETAMAEVNLSMGRSTVLHFSEKPIKVVVGNQNYLNIEFTGNDVTIQPLGFVTSNLFVYGEYRRYGFVVRVGNGQRYDDLLKVRWKSAKSLAGFAAHPKRTEEKTALKPRTVELRLRRVLYNKVRDLHVLELEIEDKTGQGITPRSIEIAIIHDRRETLIDKPIFDKENGTQKYSQVKARLFLRAQKAPTTLLVRIGGKRTEVALSPHLFE